MKTIGKEVAFLKTNENNARNGEGAFIRLNNGKIMYAYTEYTTNDGSDHAVTRISAIFSDDEGETWGEKQVLFAPGEGEQNVMSVSLLNMKNGDVGMFHGIKIKKGDTVSCYKVFRRSKDGLNWSEPVRCIDKDNYYVVNNDRVIRLKSGRIVAPAALHDLYAPKYASQADTVAPGEVCFMVSDDDGYTWKILPCRVKSPFDDKIQFQEPGIYQHEDGTIWLYIRTAYGFQMEAFSNDNCESWSCPRPNMFFTSAQSPMNVKKVKDYTVAIFNPIPNYNTREDISGCWGRSPFVCAVSKTDGKETDKAAFDRMFYLEDDRKSGYCYPAIFEGNDYFLAAYYHSEGTKVCLKSTKIKKIMYTELENTTVC